MPVSPHPQGCAALPRGHSASTRIRPSEPSSRAGHTSDFSDPACAEGLPAEWLIKPCSVCVDDCASFHWQRDGVLSKRNPERSLRGLSQRRPEKALGPGCCRPRQGSQSPGAGEGFSHRTEPPSTLVQPHGGHQHHYSEHPGIFHPGIRVVGGREGQPPSSS